MEKRKDPYYQAATVSQDHVASPDLRWRPLAKGYHNLRMAHGRVYGNIKSAGNVASYLYNGLVAAVGKMATQEKRDLGGEADASFDKFAEALTSAYIYIHALAEEYRINLDRSAENHMRNVLEKLNEKTDVSDSKR